MPVHLVCTTFASAASTADQQQTIVQIRTSQVWGKCKGLPTARLDRGQPLLPTTLNASLRIRRCRFSTAGPHRSCKGGAMEGRTGRYTVHAGRQSGGGGGGGGQGSARSATDRCVVHQLDPASATKRTCLMTVDTAVNQTCTYVCACVRESARVRV